MLSKTTSPPTFRLAESRGSPRFATIAVTQEAALVVLMKPPAQVTSASDPRMPKFVCQGFGSARHAHEERMPRVPAKAEVVDLEPPASARPGIKDGTTEPDVGVDNAGGMLNDALRRLRLQGHACVEGRR